MRKIFGKLIAALFIALIILPAAVYAQSPVAQYFPGTGRFFVSGSFEERPKTDIVNLFVIKNSADYTDFTSSDILYINSCMLDENGDYSFSFILEEYDNAKIYIKADDRYIPVSVFKTVADEDIRPVKNARIIMDDSILTVGNSEKLNLRAFDDTGNSTDYDSCSFYGYDEEIIEITGGVVTAKKQGNSYIYAKVTKNGREIEAEPVRVEVRNNAQIPSVIGVTFKKDGVILDALGDISPADEIVFAFDKAAEDIEYIRFTNLSENTENIHTGIYDEKDMTYSVFLDDELGYGKYKFEVISGTLLGKSTVIEGCEANFNLPSAVAVGNDYPVEFSVYNCRGYDIEYSDLTLSGAQNNILHADKAGEITLAAQFYVNGIKRTYSKKIRCVDVADIIVRAEKLEMDIGDTQKITALVIGSDGSILNVLPEYSVSNTKFSLDSSGILTALSIGTAKVNVSCGGVTKSFVMFAGIDGNEDSSAGIYIDGASNIERGEKQKLSLCEISVAGVKTELGGVVWSSDNETILKTEENIITGADFGEATVSAEYNGKTYKKKIAVMPRVISDAKIELESGVLPLGAYDSVRIAVNSDEYLNPREYELYSENSNIIQIENGRIFAKGEGKTKIYARLNGQFGFIETEPVEITVFTPSGGYFTDNLDDTGKIFEMDSRLYHTGDGELCTWGANDENTYVIYKVDGDINEFVVYNHICNPKYIYEDMFFYVSEDNVNYRQITDVTRYKGRQVNGWGTDVFIADSIEGEARYLKIVMNNRDGNTQATRLTGVEIGYGTEPEILDLKITDDCGGEDLYKNVLERKAVISFDQPINADTLENITVSGVKAADGIYDSNLYRYEFKIPDKSSDSCVIKAENVEGGTGKTNKSYEIKINGLDNTYKVEGSIFYELNKNESAERILIRNNTAMPKTYIVIECEYKENVLSGVNILRKGRIESASEEYVYLNYKNGNFKTFVWESFNTMLPLK